MEYDHHELYTDSTQSKNIHGVSPPTEHNLEDED